MSALLAVAMVSSATLPVCEQPVSASAQISMATAMAFFQAKVDFG
jgi:hypothetical protein